MAKKKITNETILHNGVEYTLNVNIFDIKGKYYLKNELSTDTATGQLAPSNTLHKYLLPNTNKVLYTSKPILLIGGIYGGGMTSCKSILEGNKDLIPYVSRKNAYINVNDTWIYDTVRPEKIYNISQYNKSFASKVDVPNNLSDILKEYTFGFEIETNQGFIPEALSRKFQFAQLYDGSINGVEFTSTPFTANNLHYLSNFLVNLNTAFSYNEYCSLHIHIGGIKFSEENLLVIYTLYQRLQDELTSIIAPYRKDPKYIGTKSKDHCRNLPRLLKPEVSEVYRLFLGDNYKSLLKTDLLDQTSKWNVHGRYYNVNFLNYIFKPNDQKTIEIRSSQSSFDMNYITTWLLVNVSIIDYAIKNTGKILANKEKVLLSECIDSLLEKHPDLKNSLNYNLHTIKNTIYNEYHINERLMINELGRSTNLFKNKLRPLYFDQTSKKLDYNSAEYVDDSGFVTSGTPRRRSIAVPDVLDDTPNIADRILNERRQQLANEALDRMGRAINVTPVVGTNDRTFGTITNFAFLNDLEDNS